LGALRWVVTLCGAGAPPSAPEAPEAPEAPDGVGDPVQTAGVVPGIVDACWGDEHALSSATQVVRNNTDSADMVAAATFR
jgi:hypothetical protein